MRQETLFYGFSLEEHVPADHLLRSIDRFVELSSIRQHLGPFYTYCDNYLIDVQDAVIVDVEATTAVRQAEVGAAQTMLARTRETFGLWPEQLIADTGYGSAAMLGWLVHEQAIEPHIPVVDKSTRKDSTFSREDFRYDREGDVYFCPAGNMLSTRGRVTDDEQLLYWSSTYDCAGCPLKQSCCPRDPHRRVSRSIHEGARDLARELAKTEAYATSRRQRKKVEMLSAHLKRILRLDRLRLRGLCGARDELHLAAAAQNLRKLAKLIPTGVPSVLPG